MKKILFALLPCILLFFAFVALKPEGSYAGEKQYRPQADAGVTGFPVNDPIDFNYKSKEEIYKIRKNFVEKSLFKNQGYEPDDGVFGQIAGGEAWVPLKHMYYNKNESEGVSEESRFINNPSALVMMDIAYRSITYGRYWGRDMYVLPESVFYYKKENLIKVTYSLKKFFNEVHPAHKDKYLSMLDGLNARDLGYPWVYVYESEGVTFLHNGITAEPAQFHKFIHLGMSTGHPRNNGSPRQEELEFRIDKMPSHISMKLWHNRPSSVSEKADINAELSFF